MEQQLVSQKVKAIIQAQLDWFWDKVEEHLSYTLNEETNWIFTVLAVNLVLNS